MTRCLALIAAAGLVLAACSGTAAAPTSTVAGGVAPTTSAVERDQAAPEFPEGLEWLNTARPLSIAGLRGKVVLLDFWTYGCINCLHIIPEIERLEAEYPDELVVIGVHSAKFTNEAETENIRQVIVRYGIDHPVVNDKDFLVWRQWGASAWPTLVLVDPEGTIVGGYSGEGIYPVFQPAIDSLVAEYDARGTLDRRPLDLSPETLPETVLSFPGKVLADETGGRLFVADSNHHRIVVADLVTGEVRDVGGSGLRGFVDGPFASAAFNQPQGMALSGDGGTLYVADRGNHAVRAVDLVARSVTTLVGTGEQATAYPPNAGVGPSVALSSPWDLSLVDDTLFVAMAGSHQIWTIALATGAVEPFAGTGREGELDAPRRRADLAQPSGLAYDGAGRLYFADSESSTIRWVDLAADGDVRLLSGGGDGLFDFGDRDGVGVDALLQHPLGVVVFDGRVFAADTYNSKIKVIDPATGATTTLSGGEQGWADGASPRYSEPGGISAANGFLYVADTNNHVIRRVDPTTGAADTIVLYGIERFPAATDDGGVITVALPAATVAPGPSTITIEVTLPAGYQFNDIAPFSITWTGTPGVIDPPADLAIIEPQFPLTVAAAFGSGAGTLSGDMTIYYCTEEAAELCLIDRVRLEVPVSVAAGAVADLTLDYAVPPPAG